MMFMGTLVEDQQFSGPIPEELGKLEKLAVLATGRFFFSFIKNILQLLIDYLCL